jgi:predicted  nucleic acid-binding Zn-ribbon protein
MNWYLRKEDKAIYGPVTLEMLKAWAASGRIVPGDEVSTDQQQWQPASAVSELGMEWWLDMGDGERFGPVHVMALAELVRDGTAPLHQAVQHASQGTVCTVAEAIAPALLANTSPEAVDETAHLRAALSKAEAQIHALEHRPPPPPDPELISLRAALTRAEARIVELEKEAGAEARAEQQRLQHELAQARAQIFELEAKGQTLDKIQMADGTVDAATLLQSYRELSHNYDRLLGKLNDKSDELAAAEQSHARVVKDLNLQLDSAHESAHKDRRDLDEARARLAALEHTHVDVVRSYRDLNDRYIRLRQQQSETGAPAAPIPAEKSKVRLV